jgi:hypothetical protein
MVELQRALEKVSPSESGNDELAAFMKSILGGRGEKKRAAIREAMVRVDAKQPVDSLVPPAFTESKTLDSETFSQRFVALPAEVREVDLLAPSAPLLPAPSPLSPPPAIEAPPQANPASSSFEVPNFRRRGSPVALIAAAMAIVLGIALAIWSFASDSNDAGATSGGAPVKKPW